MGCRGKVELWRNGGSGTVQRWKFGVDQSAREERDEIRTAVAAGRSDAYLRGQAFSRLIEQETARRQGRHAGRPGP
jgi:hypothetical protein